MNEAKLFNEELHHTIEKSDVILVYTERSSRPNLKCWVCCKINPFRFDDGILILNLAVRGDSK